ncbi:hypothetical protein J6590_006742 [Homalodisca vitripennis]|nr:hypothetical protein J6590_006742 [Homalodisca vitripennis]
MSVVIPRGVTKGGTQGDKNPPSKSPKIKHFRTSPVLMNRTTSSTLQDYRLVGYVGTRNFYAIPNKGMSQESGMSPAHCCEVWECKLSSDAGGGGGGVAVLTRSRVRHARLGRSDRETLARPRLLRHGKIPNGSDLGFPANQRICYRRHSTPSGLNIDVEAPILSPA